MPDPTLIETAKQAAAQYGVPESLFLSQIQQESSFNPGAVPAGGDPATGPAGIAQFIPSTAAQYGVTNRFDPVQSLWGAAAYDAALYKQSGSWSKVLGSYGTVPTSGPLTPSQQALANQAQTLDNSGMGSPGATVGGPLATPVAFPVPNLGNIGGWIGDFFIRAGVILLGIVIIWQGLAMLRNTTIIEQVQTVRTKMGRGVKQATS